MKYCFSGIVNLLISPSMATTQNLLCSYAYIPNYFLLDIQISRERGKPSIRDRTLLKGFDWVGTRANSTSLIRERRKSEREREVCPGRDETKGERAHRDRVSWIGRAALGGGIAKRQANGGGGGEQSQEKENKKQEIPS